jgi:steroid delta-isomerase-like uncharacterized protein
MSTESNKAIVRRVNDELISQGKMAVADELFADGFVDHSAFPGLSPDREGVKMLFTTLRGGFPDLHVTIQDQVAEGDKVVTRKTFHGTHKGELFGIPATGKSVSFGVIDILQICDNHVTDHWTVVDQLGLMQQLGVIPQPEEATA